MTGSVAPKRPKAFASPPQEYKPAQAGGQTSSVPYPMTVRHELIPNQQDSVFSSFLLFRFDFSKYATLFRICDQDSLGKSEMNRHLRLSRISREIK